MATSSAHRPAPGRGRRAATAISMLVAVTGATAVASATTPHAAARKTYRVLSIVTTSGQDPVYRTPELQYITPHNRYELDHDYEGTKLEDIEWQKDVRDGRRRPVNRVLIDPGAKTWFEYRKTFGPLPPHPFGIRSTTKQVAAAIQDGKARLGGLTRKDGQQVRLLTISTKNDHVGSDLLWVNPVTDRPVAERKTFLLGHVPNPGRIRTVTSDWENVSLQALNQLRDEPKIPVGYEVEHPKRAAPGARSSTRDARRSRR